MRPAVLALTIGTAVMLGSSVALASHHAPPARGGHAATIHHQRPFITAPSERGQVGFSPLPRAWASRSTPMHGGFTPGGTGLAGK